MVCTVSDGRFFAPSMALLMRPARSENLFVLSPVLLSSSRAFFPSSL